MEGAKELLEGILETCENDGERTALKDIIGNLDSISVPDEFLEEGNEGAGGEAADDGKRKASIDKLTIPQKVKLALFGNHTARMYLIRDNSSRQIPLFVLKNPRITDGEILEFAKNANLDGSVHRSIAANSQWMRTYAMKVAICFNPKVPVDLTLKWIKFLQDKDMKRLSQSKNIAQVVATHCRRLLDQKAKQ